MRTVKVEELSEQAWIPKIQSALKDLYAVAGENVKSRNIITHRRAKACMNSITYTYVEGHARAIASYFAQDNRYRSYRYSFGLHSYIFSGHRVHVDYVLYANTKGECEGRITSA